MKDGIIRELPYPEYPPRQAVADHSQIMEKYWSEMNIMSDLREQIKKFTTMDEYVLFKDVKYGKKFEWYDYHHLSCDSKCTIIASTATFGRDQKCLLTETIQCNMCHKTHVNDSRYVELTCVFDETCPGHNTKVSDKMTITDGSTYVITTVYVCDGCGGVTTSIRNAKIGDPIHIAKC
jgi:hypothetical protein